MRSKSKIRFKFLVSGLLILFLFAGSSFYLGYYKGVREPKELTVNLTNIDSDINPTNFGIFWEVWDKLKNEHIDGAKAQDQNLVYGAISGLVGALDDPNTIFFPPADSKKFVEDVRGSFGGIGAEIGIKDSQLVVIAPLKNSPAEKSGLKTKDQILEIDGEPTGGLADVGEAVKKIRGEVGTSVALTIAREQWEQPKKISIVREVIQIPTVDWELKENNIAYIRLYSFNERAAFAFHNAIIEASLKGADGVILDLRNNPGGFLEVAVELAGWFLDKGKLVVAEEFRSGERRDFYANGNAALRDIPTVILVNGGSASASEILAGALRDHLGTKLIGEKTFGKGTVQELQDLSDGSSLKVTIAHWLLPKGAVIEKNGLEPDVEVKPSEDDLKNEKDPQLDKAIEILKSQLNP